MTRPVSDQDFTTPTTVDIPRLRKAVEWVEEQAALPIPDRTWDQRMWRWTNASRMHHAAREGYCGTTYCVAGKILEDEGIDWSCLAPSVDAARVLGLTEDQAEDLFDANNTAADIRSIAEDIAGERL